MSPFIADLNQHVDGELQALTEEAASELVRFDAEAGQIAAPFAAVLLRTESASSSEIENLTGCALQIALAELGGHASKNAQLIVGNVRAMQTALTLSESIDGHGVLEMHRALLDRSNPDMVGHWRDRVKARRDSAAHRLVDVLLRQPVIDSAAAATQLGISAVNAQAAINRLVDAGVLTQISAGRRNRIWLAKDIVRVLDEFGARAKRRG